MATQDGDVIETTVIHENTESGLQVNRYQWEVAAVSPIADADLLDDVADFINALYQIVKGFISIKNVFREVRVTNITQDILIGSTLAPPYVGGNGADPASPQGVSAYVYFTTAYPRIILSKYLPSNQQGVVAGTGGLSGAWLVANTAFVAALMTTQVETYGSYQYGYLSPKAMQFVVPLVGIAQSVLAYQRRRKKGRGA